MTIGEIITTPQGLAVVAQVLPATYRLGSETLHQVVAEPLTGGPPPLVPAVPTPPGEQPLTPYQVMQSLAAAAYVAFVAVQPPSTEGSGGTVEPGGNSRAPPCAYSAAAQAYQSTLDLASQTGPQVVVVG